MTGQVVTDDETVAIEHALAALDLETKVRLLSGQDYWTLPAIPEIGLASLVMSDGPIGVRGVRWAPDDPSVALPSPTALAATWDPELARRAGRLLGQECRRKGIHVLLAPTVNLHRSPFGGRHFECYSEDPLLTAEIGAGYVAGLQDQGVGGQVKHFVANDSETERFTVDVRVSERALRELYLVPFERIVASGVWSVMAAYNGVNGATMTEQRDLLVGLLKDEWGFDGPVVSDWTAARSTVPTALGGLDVVMPAFGDPWGDQLVAAVRSGAVAEELVDDKVRRVLRLAARVGALSSVPGAVPESARPAVLDGDAVAREVAARSTVLARNAGDLLPLDAGTLRRVAVAGALADDARIQGGGSAMVEPLHVISPLAGITAALPGATVSYAVGADPRPKLPTAGGLEWTPITATLRDAGGAALYSTSVDTAMVKWMGEPPSGVDPDSIAAIELSATFTPAVTGTHQLGANGFGNITLRVGGVDLLDEPLFAEGEDLTQAFLSPVERRFPVEAVAGEPTEVVLSQQVFPGMAGFVWLFLGHARPSAGPEELLASASAEAAEADVAIVVVGTTAEVESEGFDRATLALPGLQDELVRRVAAANPRTVVVVNSGSPVLMPWLDEVAAVLLTWFPGQEAGAALADVLLGVTEPGGRLPTTWPAAASAGPVLSTTPTAGTLAYDEELLIGYRSWIAAGATPLLPFGHGLGYTTWSYESLEVTRSESVSGAGSESASGAVFAEVTVRNTGGRAGREVVQVYVSPEAPAGSPAAGGSGPSAGSAAGPGSPARPPVWLAGFASAVAAPGEAVTVRVPLHERTFQIWDGAWKTVPGGYTVEAGSSVRDRHLTASVDI